MEQSFRLVPSVVNTDCCVCLMSKAINFKCHICNMAMICTDCYETMILYNRHLNCPTCRSKRWVVEIPPLIINITPLEVIALQKKSPKKAKEFCAFLNCRSKCKYNSPIQPTENIIIEYQTTKFPLEGETMIYNLE